jgi:hypothetical protein
MVLAVAAGCGEPVGWDDAGDADEADAADAPDGADAPDSDIECPEGWSSCGGTCVSLLADSANCGRCGRSCGPDEHCEGGACAPGCADECPAGARQCFVGGWRQCGEYDETDDCLEWSAVQACPAGSFCNVETGTCAETCGDFCDPFSVILIPDPQNYTSRQALNSHNTFVKQMQWIVDNRTEENIRFVINLGDNTNHNWDSEWRVTDAAYALLDEAGVPYSMLPGNHDYFTPDGFSRGGTQFNDYFGQERFEGQPWYGGGFGSGNTNNYTFFDWGALRFMVISLEYAPRKDALCWAEQLIADHPDRRVIIATHCYLTRGGSHAGCPSDEYVTLGASGSDTLDELVARHSNVFLVVSGHVGGSELNRVVGNNGNRLYEMLTDFQFENACTASSPSQCTSNCREGSHTGNGWMRQLVFDPRANEVSFRDLSVEEGNPDVFPDGEPAFFCSPLYDGAGRGGDYYDWDPTTTDHQDSFDYDMRTFAPDVRDDLGYHAFIDRTVNSVADGDQLTPVVAVAPSGDFVVVWEDDSRSGDGSGHHDILARGFSAGGCSGFADVVVNTNTAGHQQTPAMAMDAAGNFVVAWADDSDDNGVFQVHARGFNFDGTERFPTFTVNSVDDGQQLNPAVAMAPDGRFVVAWEDDPARDGNFQILMRGFAADGTERFADRSVHATAEGVRIRPAVGMADDGGFVVTWQDDTDANGTYQIHARGFTADGAERFARLTVNTVDAGQQRNPAIGVASSGAFVVAWEDDQNRDGEYQTLARGFGADGRPGLSDFRVHGAAGGNHLRPSLSMAPDGTFAITWEDDGGADGWYQVHAAAFSSEGADLMAEWTVNRIADGQQRAPSIGLNAEGTIAVAWQDDMDGNDSYQILAAGFDAP